MTAPSGDENDVAYIRGLVKSIPGMAACDHCDYVKAHCRCPKPIANTDELESVFRRWVKSKPDAEVELHCPNCGNEYLAIRKDVYKDLREFVYCDCCGFLAEEKYTRVLMDTYPMQCVK